MAASLIFALILLFRSLHPSLDQTAIVQQNPEAAAPRNHPIPEPVSNPTPKPPIAQNDLLPSHHEKPPVSLVEVESADQRREREDRIKITRMLEKPEVRVILITTDVIDASNQIQSLIQNDPRPTPDFGRITLRTGIVVDPNRPGSAEVFVVPVNEGGRESFVTKLREKFNQLKEEDPKSVPDLVTQLTEVGQVAIFQRPQASPLVEPPVDVRTFAVRTGSTSGGDRYFSGQETGGVGVPDSPKHSHDMATADANLFVGPPTRLKPNDPVTLLVWVTRPGKL